MRSKRELETEQIIDDFISYIRFGTDRKYNEVETYDAIEDMYELYQYYRSKEKRKSMRE